MITQNAVRVPDCKVFTPEEIYGKLGALALSVAKRPRILGVAVRQQEDLVAVISTAGYVVYTKDGINRSHDCIISNLNN